MSVQRAPRDERAWNRAVAVVFGKPISIEELRDIAAGVLQHRQRVARGLVNTGRWDEAEADRRTAPWLAIAVLCWVSTPSIEFHLEPYRRPLVYIGEHGQKPRYDYIAPEEIARAQLATDTCSAIAWSAALAEATVGALKAFHENRTEATERAARDLIAISRALDVPTRPAAPPAPVERIAA